MNYTKRKKKVVTITTLLDIYLFVSRCWNNHQLAVEHKMSVGKALKALRMVISEAGRLKNGKMLVTRARALLQNIVEHQENDQELEASGGASKAR